MVGSVSAPQLPGYRDLSPLGRGGYSEVYSAYQDQFDRWVAVKVLTFSLTDDRAQRRFLRECRVAGRLSTHPNIVTVYDAGLSPDGRPYISMELFDRGSIADRLRNAGPFELADVLRIVVGVAGALETAHRAGVVHRDVKPGNVLLASYGQPALTDFGLSILAERQEVSVGVDALTPYHAPPEVLERTAITAASDVYSLASTTYAMLAGRAPHQRPGDQDSMASLLLRILQTDIPPIGRPDVPASLDAALQAALAREADDRTPSALAFARGLQQVQGELGLEVTQPVVMDSPQGSELVPAPPGAQPGASSSSVTRPSDSPGPALRPEVTLGYGSDRPGDATVDRPGTVGVAPVGGRPGSAGAGPPAPPPGPPGVPNPPGVPGPPGPPDHLDLPGGAPPPGPPPPPGAPGPPSPAGPPPGAAPGPDVPGPTDPQPYAAGAGAGDPAGMGDPRQAPGAPAVFSPQPPGPDHPTGYDGTTNGPGWAGGQPAAAFAGGPGRSGAPDAPPAGPPRAGTSWSPAFGDQPVGPFDGDATVHRATMWQARTSEPEAAPATGSRRPALVVASVLVVVGLAAGGVLMLTRGGGEPEPEPESTTTTTTVPDLERPTGLRATESSAGVLLEWEGDNAADYVVVVLSEADPPEFLSPQVGASQLVPATSLRDDVGYCFMVALLSSLSEAPSGQEAEAFTSPECIRGASEDTVLLE